MGYLSARDFRANLTKDMALRCREKYVDSRIAGEFLNLHAKTVERMARRGELPGHPVGAGQRKRWRFLLSELDASLRSRVISHRHPCREDRREANV